MLKNNMFKNHRRRDGGHKRFGFDTIVFGSIGRAIAATGLFCAVLTGLAANRTVAAAPPPVAQQRFVRFGPGQGLSSIINDLAIDRQGYVWAATGDGLARYDGIGFRFWRREVGLDSSLPDNDLIALALDADDRLWVASSDHLSVLDGKRQRFRRMRFEGEAAACGRDITAIAAAAGGDVWVAGFDGTLCRISRDGGIRRLSPVAAGSAFAGVPSALMVLASGDLLVGTDISLYRRRGDVMEEVAPGMLRGAQTFWVGNDGKDPDGSAWIGTDRGLYRYSADGSVRPSPWALPPLATNAVVLRDQRGTYWIGTAAGLYRAASMDAPALAAHGARSDDGLSSGVFVQRMDREGGLWFASYSQGLSYLPPGHDRFAVIDEIAGTAMERADPLAVASDGHGGFWIVGSRMLYALRADDASAHPVASAESLGAEWLQTLARCPDGRLWLASFDRVIEFDPSRRRPGRSLRYPNDGTRTPQTLLCIGDGRLWVAFFGGGLRVYAPEGRLLHELAPEAVLGGSGQDYARLQHGPDGMPWLSDGQRLRRWNGERFEPLAMAAGEAIGAFTFVAPNTVWVARYGSLERHEWQDGKLALRERVGVEAGLPTAHVAGMLAAGNGQLWLSTARGLVQYDARSRRARSFGLRDGLPDIDFMLGAPILGGRGQALALSKRGLALFDPDRPLPVPRASALAIDAVDLRRGEDTVMFSGSAGGELRAVMRAGDRDLRVAARVMSFADPAAHRYRFRLRGFDPDWVMQGERGERVFSALPPGRYVLEVQGANADGVWSPTRRVGLQVEAPWWRRGWAWMLYAAAAVAMLWWLAYLDRMRLKRRHNYQLIKQKRELAEEASQAKSRFLANLGHEVRTPMTGVLGMSELLLSTALDNKQQGQVHAIRRAGSHLLRLVNDALDLARIEAGRFELDHADFQLDVLIDDAIALMRPLAERKALALVVDIADGARGGWQGDATRLSQILLNLLGNAIKFTARGEVALSVDTLAPNGLRLTVRDTGPGLDEQQQRRLFRRFEQAEGARTASRYGGSGLGLAICQELAVAMGGGIELLSAPGEGAAFIVRLPLMRAKVAFVAPVAPHSALSAAHALHVLLAEDDAIVADVLVGLLQAQGHRVVHAGHALAALAEVATRRFDLALIDLDLPGMDGLALARHLRAQKFTQPMVAVTARADAEAEPQALEAGFDGFLRKPLTGDMLAEAMALHRPTPA